MISAAMMLPTIAPTAVPPSLDEPGADVGPAEVELEVTEDPVDEPVNEPVGRDPVEEGPDDGKVSDGESDVGGKVEDGVAGVEEGVGVASLELGGVGDTGGDSVVLGGGVGPP
jgi:hypothetical protein